jgi:hypothetical protein
MMCDINFQPKMDVVKEEWDFHPPPSHSEGEEAIGIKCEDEPLPEPFGLVKTEVYVSHIFYLCFMPLGSVVVGVMYT